MIKLADRRLLTNISTVGTSENGVNIYNFEYKNCNYGCGLFQGAIADEVTDAVIGVNEDGYSMINYDMIDVEFKQIEDYSLYAGASE